MIRRNPLVMIPGPTPVARSIQDAMGRETISYNDPRLVADFKALVDDLASMWKCDGLAFVVAGSGTMAMEMGVVNIASHSDRVLVCSNGYFGDRYVDICSRKGFETETLRPPRWGESVTVSEVDEKLRSKKFDVLVLTHVETSTGVEFPLRGLCRMMRESHPDVLIVVDGVASMGGVDFYMDWGADVMITCSQKCFGTAPGLGLLWASRRAIGKRESMGQITETYIDFEKWVPVMRDTNKYWGTPPVNMVWALCEAVRIIKEEGLENRFRRHTNYAGAIRKSLRAMGFSIGAADEFASPTVTVAKYPDGCGLDDAAFRSRVYDEGAHIAGCLGDFAGKGFRIGHMGNIDDNILVSLIASIERACIKCGYKIEPGVGLGAMQQALLGM
ncbi:MAG: alanine--glyoxylate aminotransferase family protein [Synergistaceae bacterium]|jgi:aspartate aminotransferase-like enzyme|nr:alanine--glyoxylate aminotransferase family protein [Synergistaceae bacterium]